MVAWKCLATSPLHCPISVSGMTIKVAPVDSAMGIPKPERPVDGVKHIDMVGWLVGWLVSQLFYSRFRNRRRRRRMKKRCDDVSFVT